ncbi:MAG TPA: hypothetical protein VKA38_08570 [Draconibacterium sp.]|nr:hypothetical protein [Draconibacterium sp.]
MKKYYKLLLFAVVFPVVFQLNSCEGDRARYGCDCETTKEATKEVIISPSHTKDSSSTYDNSGGIYADAGCHAKMTIEFSWVDPVLCNGETRPPISYEFQSLFGWFPANEGMETVSVGSDGITNVWKISISEAIDKSKPDGSSYGISVNWTGPTDATEAERKGVRCKISITYNQYDEAYYRDGC